jgi:hypothetical protein
MPVRRIDAHAHMIGDHPEVFEILDHWGLKVMNISVPDDQWAPWRTTEHPHYERLAKSWPQRFAWCTSFDVPGPADDPHYVEKQLESLDQDFEHGAICLKLYYNIGELAKKSDGSFWRMDDPLFEPIFEHIEKRQWPVVWHFGGEEAARDPVLERYRKTRFIGAHLGTLPDCLLKDIQRLLDQHPNFAVDTSAGVRRLLKQDPKAVRDFFIQYQDRILFGTDLGAFEEMVSYPFSGMPEAQRKDYVATLKTAYESQFGYYENKGPVKVFEWGFFEGQGLDLPEAVLQKLYFSNAKLWLPGIA